MTQKIDTTQIQPGDSITFRDGNSAVVDSDYCITVFVDTTEVSGKIRVPVTKLNEHSIYKITAGSGNPVSWLTEEDLSPVIRPWTDREAESNLANKILFDDILLEINTILTNKYHNTSNYHIFKGEPASQFGIDDDTWIHVWDGIDWVSYTYAELSPGEYWKKQPPPPKQKND